MAMLHTVNKSPFENRSLDSCLKFAVAGASVLLIEDGIFGALKETALSAKLKVAMQNINLYVLGPDLKARGMEASKLIDGIKVVDYGGFVDLVAEHDKVQSWL